MSARASAGKPRAPAYGEPGGSAASQRSGMPTAPVPDTLDVRHLPSFGFGARSLMWWATAGLMLIAAFFSGWLALTLVFVSPLDALTGALFSAHMVQHEAMMLVCAPLIVLGRPLGVMLWALSRPVRLAIGRLLHTHAWTRCWRRLASPLWAWWLHAIALWAWHAPRLFEAALANAGVHTLQHASFLLTALLFWRGIVGEMATRRSTGSAMLSLFTTMVHTGALGALIALAPGVWYPSYIEPTSALGMDPLQDQQLGGLIMWVPGALAYLIGALAVASRWLRERPGHRWRPAAQDRPALEETR
ncbi:cytochrome c oxidase assembly protein [Trinickia sp. Y13]|uniref:cytochrome c oxidase assembly protein n=1 Tax=Trinickia sp. Y13 TaxID=2917807 RepID=UPI002406C3A2|nr:cytochrome c oxidase assembly protein [Trinickia sp. Y13]MDG0025389.1 cytochrome c oxidase assembly protein [Trinickia sp. Y13]